MEGKVLQKFVICSLLEELEKVNEDGITIPFYLKKIYPDHWKNFEQRIQDPVYGDSDGMELERQWVSYRGQTLFRTAPFGGYRDIDVNHKEHRILKEQGQALAELKFTYVVSCQKYGAQKKSREINTI
ncbi:callose synthase 7-like isoform X2 [Olea europaea subsp. europaea]|uniref:Callose synthase 7-like isoform X2 n=1 Tax=Olea europaea subsp. europaea TaxID=158383 RepID=A0A8S0TT36_OLEEU|nr:callose synthase 7-like isoform X2 [Olea europaea subsp. europaea]